MISASILVGTPDPQSMETSKVKWFSIYLSLIVGVLRVALETAQRLGLVAKVMGPNAVSIGRHILLLLSFHLAWPILRLKIMPLYRFVIYNLPPFLSPHAGADGAPAVHGETMHRPKSRGRSSLRILRSERPSFRVTRALAFGPSSKQVHMEILKASS